ncbi:MAG: ABC transporter ATP-binding protein [Motiliproteus sp.]
MSILRLRHLYKSYRNGQVVVPILQGLELDMREGEILMLLGPSGSGKSTLLNLIAGIDAADAGAIEIDGTSISALNERQRTLFRRQHIGTIYQFFNLIPTLTVLENILLPLQLNGRMDERPRALLQMQRLGIEQHKHLFPEQLSGGEQQRVAICRALTHRPKLLLADEPTGSLDLASATVVMQLLLEQVREFGQSLVLVTHNPQITARANRLLRLDQGLLVEA